MLFAVLASSANKQTIYEPLLTDKDRDSDCRWKTLAKGVLLNGRPLNVQVARCVWTKC